MLDHATRAAAVINSAVVSETMVYFHQSKTKLPGRPCRATLMRWAKKGRRVIDSTRYITLEYAMFGGMPVTSTEAFTRFLQRLNGELAPARKAKK